MKTLPIFAMGDAQPAVAAEIPADFVPSLDSYDVVVLAFSGGKDSLAALLRLLELGVPRESIELHHHDIDGREKPFMDWAVTPSYCQAVADALGIKLYGSWRQGGFLAEMMKTVNRSKPILFEDEGRGGGLGQSGGIKGKIETRRMFPQQTANLAMRWCSASLKIDVLDAVLRNSERFQGKKILVVTGERAEESPNRAKYKSFAEHRSHAKSRPTDHWLAVHAWSEAQVWDIISRHRIKPHPAYQLGWGRLSCMTCIFGSADQWASIRAVFPPRFHEIADKETEFGVTIRRGMTVAEIADRGTPYRAAVASPELVALAAAEEWHGSVIDENWTMPAGAFGENAGPR